MAAAQAFLLLSVGLLDADRYEDAGVSTLDQHREAITRPLEQGAQFSDVLHLLVVHRKDHVASLQPGPGGRAVDTLDDHAAAQAQFRCFLGGQGARAESESFVQTLDLAGCDLARTGKRLSRWFREMKSELKKVVWPTKSQMVNNTVIVLVCTLIVGICIWVFDAVGGVVVNGIITLVRG